jgi:CrcB protein
MRAARLFGFGFPYGTLAVNVVGSVIMGLLTEFKNCASS